MSRDPAHTALITRAPSSDDPAARSAVRFLTRGPAGLSSPITTWAVNLLAVGGAAMLVWSGVIHLQLAAKP